MRPTLNRAALSSGASRRQLVLAVLSKAGFFLLAVGFFVLLVAYLLPIIWMAICSFKTQGDAYAMPPRLIFTPTFMNYHRVLVDRHLLMFLKNSFVVVCISSVVTVLIGTMAAFALSRYDFRGGKNMAFFILSCRIAPPVMVIFPVFIMYRNFLGLYNTYPGMILIYVNFNLPLAVWLLRGFIQEIPKELDEAATIDGCSKWGGFWRIVFPLCSPGIVATTILSFIFSWNEYFFALILTAQRTRTLPVTVTSFVTGMGIEWGELNAAGVIIVLPVILFAFAMQKYLIHGLTLGAVKG
jgi:multiple sugar transport system permease protein